MKRKKAIFFVWFGSDLGCPTPTEDREALTVAREEGVFDSRLVKLSGVTPLTSFRSWEARGHLKAGGPDAFQGCGTPGRWG